MGKFDKAMGAMDDEMLEDVNGGISLDLDGLNLEQLYAKLEEIKAAYAPWEHLYYDHPVAKAYRENIAEIEARIAELEQQG